VTVGAFLSYAVLYLALWPFGGPASTVVTMIPIGVTAYLWGLRWSIGGSVAGYGMSMALWAISGVAPGEAIVRAGSGVGALGVMLLAAGVGHLRDLNVRTAQLARELTVLRDAARAVSSAAGRDDALSTILAAAVRVVPCRVGTLWLARHEDEFEAVAAVGSTRCIGLRIPVDDSIVARAFRTRRTQIVPDARNVAATRRGILRSERSWPCPSSPRGARSA